MANENSMHLVGTAGRDPELKYTTSGRAVCSFGLAVNRRWKDRNDEWQEQTSWFNVTAWGDLGENVAASLTKGARVIVVGRMEQRSYETREGEKRTVYDLVADAIGPDLRWATCEVTKIERDQAPRQAAAAPAADYGDEEPF